MVLAMSPDAEDFAAEEFARISREYLGVWLFSSEIAKAIVQELLDRGFRVKLNGSLQWHDRSALSCIRHRASASGRRPFCLVVQSNNMLV